MYIIFYCSSNFESVWFFSSKSSTISFWGESLGETTWSRSLDLWVLGEVGNFGLDLDFSLAVFFRFSFGLPWLLLTVVLFLSDPSDFASCSSKSLGNFRVILSILIGDIVFFSFNFNFSLSFSLSFPCFCLYFWF